MQSATSPIAKIQGTQPMTSGTDITLILQDWDNDRPRVMEQLTPVVYAELRRIAARYLRNERPNHTLQPTALINEAYLHNRAHFYALAARLMRQILVDAARVRHSEKRGAGGCLQLNADLDVGAPDRGLDMLVVHDALEKLGSHSPRVAQVVELRYFGGLELKEIAETLSISLATMKRDLTLGQAWLRRALAEQPS